MSHFEKYHCELRLIITWHRIKATITSVSLAYSAVATVKKSINGTTNAP